MSKFERNIFIHTACEHVDFFFVILNVDYVNM